MEKITFCYVLILSVTLAYDMNLYVYSFENYFFKNKHWAKPEPTAIFTFGFNRYDLLQMNIYLRNKEPNMNAGVYIKTPSDNVLKRKVSKIETYDTEKNYYSIIQHLWQSNISIEIELYTATGLCTRKVIIKGKDNSTYNGMCLYENKCVIEVDLLNIKCDGQSIGSKTEKDQTPPRHGTTETTATQNNTSHSGGTETEKGQTTPRHGTTETTATQNNTSHSVGTETEQGQTTPHHGTTETTATQNNTSHSVGTETEQGQTTPRHGTTETTATQNNTRPSIGIETEQRQTTSRYGTTETTATQNNTITDVKPFGSTIIAVIIVCSIIGMVIVVLLIIAIWKYWQYKRHLSATPQLPVNPPSDPFYVNMLFRRECEEEIAELEQHHYEEIDPREQVTEDG